MITKTTPVESLKHKDKWADISAEEVRDFVKEKDMLEIIRVKTSNISP